MSHQVRIDISGSPATVAQVVQILQTNFHVSSTSPDLAADGGATAEAETVTYTCWLEPLSEQVGLLPEVDQEWSTQVDLLESLGRCLEDARRLNQSLDQMLKPPQS